MMIKELKKRLNEIHDNFGYYDPFLLKEIVADVRREEDGVTVFDVVSAMLEVTRS